VPLGRRHRRGALHSTAASFVSKSGARVKTLRSSILAISSRASEGRRQAADDGLHFGSSLMQGGRAERAGRGGREATARPGFSMFLDPWGSIEIIAMTTSVYQGAERSARHGAIHLSKTSRRSGVGGQGACAGLNWRCRLVHCRSRFEERTLSEGEVADARDILKERPHGRYARWENMHALQDGIPPLTRRRPTRLMRKFQHRRCATKRAVSSARFQFRNFREALRFCATARRGVKTITPTSALGGAMRPGA